VPARSALPVAVDASCQGWSSDGKRRVTLRTVLTGAAGFVGANVADKLLARGHEVSGLDNFDNSYPVALKRDRIERLSRNPNFTFREGDIRNEADVALLFECRPHAVIHLAAQGGLRRSMDDPSSFISSNLTGFGNVLEAAAQANVENFVYASSGAVYGGTSALPFREDDPAAWPMSLYGATKRCDELISFTYAVSRQLRCTGLRFFTVYGPDGRPDMATYSFAKAISEGSPIRVHGHGRMVRDFVYVDDVAQCVILAAEDKVEFGTSPIGDGPVGQLADAPWRVLNVATGRQVSVLKLIELIEDAAGRKAEKIFVDKLSLEVQESRADLTALEKALGFVPGIRVEEGIPRAVGWYLKYLRECDAR
jgi:UDP-glucuronate 4-epimerase